MNETQQPKICFYKHTGDANIVASGCEPNRAWIPQMDMNYCPFCGGHLKILRIATSQELLVPPRAG